MEARLHSMLAVHLDRPLGVGGLAAVWPGAWGKAGHPVAVKVTRTAHAAFADEVRAVARLDHPGIIAVHDHGTLGEEPPLPLPPNGAFLVMDRAEGTLAGLRAPLPPEEVVAILRHLLGALAHAHARGVIHRDIKPANVLRVRGDWVLADFGLACAIDAESGDEEYAQGTPAYMAPEQFWADWRAYGPPTDLYALACLGWALLTGEPPFGRAPLARVRAAHVEKAPGALPAGTPPRLEAMLRRCLQKEPRDRYCCAADALAALADPADTLTRSLTEPRPSLSGRPSAGRRAMVGGLSLLGLRPIPLVGRNRECAELRAALADLDRPRVVSLEGPAGVGKSRLAEWLCEWASETGRAHVLRARHSAHPGPGQGIAAMLARELRLHGLDRAAVAERLGDHPDADALADVVAPSTATDRGISVIQLQAPGARHAAVGRHLERLARDRAVILWIDDAQLAADALALVMHVLSHSKARILFVLTVRPEAALGRGEEAQLAAIPTTRIAVGPLPAREHGALVRELLGFGGKVAQQVAERTAGNPLFAVHLVADWVNRGVLDVQDGRLALRSGTAVELPDDVRAAWDAQIDALIGRGSAEDEQALELAATLGAEVHAEEWERAGGALGLHPPRALVGALLSARLARYGEGRDWAFVHPMLRECLLRRAQTSGREGAMHRACAHALAGRDDTDSVERRARHLLAAGDLDAALPLLVAAANGKTRAAQMSDAARLLDLWESSMEEADVPEADPRWAEGWLARVAWAIEGGQPDLGEVVGRRLVHHAQTHGWPDLARGLRELGRLALVRSDHEAALGLLRRSESIALEAGDRQTGGFARRDQGDLHFHAGRLEEAARLYGLAADDLHAAQAPTGLGTCWLGLAGIAQRLQRLDEAAAYTARARACFETAGYRVGQATCWSREGEYARLRGDLDRAEACYREAAERFRTVRAQEVAILEMNLALVEMARGNFPEAEALLVRALEALERDKRPTWAACASACLLPCLALRRDWVGWDEQLDRAERGLQQLADDDVAGALERGGDLAREAGERRRAQGAWRLAQRQWQALGRRADSRRVDGKLGRP